jgi:hypothetical protein
MKQALRSLFNMVLCVLSFRSLARAQVSNQVWPEVSAFVRLNSSMRFYFLGTTVKENRESTEGEYGPNFDFYLKPLRRQKKWMGIPLDESKNRFLMVRAGYRYLHNVTGTSPDEHRGVFEVTPRFPLAVGVLVSNRNRMDFRFIGGEYSWRYRNRLTVEREFALGRFKFNPYARGEVYFDSRFDKWSRTALTAGSSFPITKHLELESHFEHQNDTGGSSNRQVNAIGAVCNLYF